MERYSPGSQSLDGHFLNAELAAVAFKTTAKPRRIDVRLNGTFFWN